ncbi:hypothetical protein ACIBEJ_38895 [Nonomuraea sp. NPDC050790]|uniref:hypothetical protein n=1 Tax=Nonomuraea sp. NPDC050790 TaxID=3364371 RepID=UPI00378C82A5
MRTWLRLSKLAAAVAAALTLAATGASAAAAQEARGAAACGVGSVFLDGLRAVDVLEEGDRDEVYIRRENGSKLWPTTAAYVSMAEGQRVEVDKCVPVGETLRLWDDDGPVNPDDFMGIATICCEINYDEYFDNGSSRYRLGVIA